MKDHIYKKPRFIIFVVSGVLLLLIILYYAFSLIYPLFARYSTVEEAYKKVFGINKPQVIDILEMNDIAVAVCRKGNTITRPFLFKDDGGWIPSLKNNMKERAKQEYDGFVIKVYEKGEDMFLLIYDIQFNNSELTVNDSMDTKFLHSKITVNGIDTNTWLCEINSIPENYCLILNGERVEIVI